MDVLVVSWLVIPRLWSLSLVCNCGRRHACNLYSWSSLGLRLYARADGSGATQLLLE